jgi:hypothetical protein
MSSKSFRPRGNGKLISCALVLGLLAAVFVAAPAPSQASIAVGVSVGVAPPPIPVYAQPVCPGPGYMWTPGYWGYDAAQGYYWVPGTWVMAPSVGLLWTPGYWGWGGAAFLWHAGYWGPHIGFYGGVNYGFGYAGVGYAGGRWVGDSFAYNRTVNNVDTSVIHHIYSEALVNNVPLSRVSYNGGPGGTTATVTAQERAAAAEPHIPPTALQRQISQEAAGNPALMAHANERHPAMAVTHRATVSGAPRVARGPGTVAPPAHATSAPGTVDQPNRVHSPRPTTRPEDAADQPAAPKPADATSTKPQQHPKRP